MEHKNCKVCNSHNRIKIENAIESGLSVRKIGAEYGFTHAAIQRHKIHILPTVVIKKADEIDKRNKDLLQEIDFLMEELKRIVERSGKNASVSIQAMKELRLNIELLAKLYIQIEKWRTRDIAATKEWQLLKKLIMPIFETYPGAKEDFLMATKRIDKDVIN